jgi:hypothetical protein
MEQLVVVKNWVRVPEMGVEDDYAVKRRLHV